MNSDTENTSLSRRRLIVGGATALAGAGAVRAQSGPADMDYRHVDQASEGVAVRTMPEEVVGASSPVTVTLATAPPSGTTVRSVNMYQFEPFLPAGQRTWGYYGTYSAGTATAMRASIDIPVGALIQSVEYYVYNNSGETWGADAYLYVPGQGYLSSISASVSIPSTNTLAAYSSTAGYTGPYPLGSMVLLSISTPSTGTVQINGGRVAFSQGAALTGLLPAPVRVYDSRTSDGRIAAGAMRTITIPSSIVVPGTTGVIANVTAVNGSGYGYLRIWPASATEPASSTINYPPTYPVANAVVLGVSNSGQINIRSSPASADVIIDVIGVVA